MKIFMNLDSMDTIRKLTSLCERYAEDLDVDVLYGRYILNGRSILALAELVGYNVQISPENYGKLNAQKSFEEELKKLGATFYKGE